ncbi:MAG: Type 1 glutamine amidotransferase-like domain-containing protein [Patescibacteria group bacterium]
MGNIILTSSFSTVAKELYEKGLLPHEPVKVGFVTTAADPYKNKPWMEADRKALIDLGYAVIDIDLKDKTSTELQIVFNDTRILFIAGGNAPFLVEHAHRSGLREVIKKALDDGELFIGSSAGSILAGPSVEPFVEEDAAELPKTFSLQNSSCLGLVDYIVLPHYPHYAQRNDKLAEQYGKQYKFQKLNDREYRVETSNDI